MTTPQLIIAIDPDTDKSGVAFLHLHNGSPRPSFWVEALPFPEAIDAIADQAAKAKADGAKVVAYVEAGWLEAISNYHGADGRRGQKIAKNVGANHQTGKHLIEMLRHRGIDARPMRPLRKCWQGRDRKITHAELARIVGAMPARSNQEQRDALLLAWVAAGLPIRL